jgi:PAS domain S-box-containing protein
MDQDTTLRRWFEAWNTRDIERIRPYAHPAIEFITTGTSYCVPRGTNFRGVDGLQSLLDLTGPEYPDIHNELLEIAGVGGRAVIASVFTTRNPALGSAEIGSVVDLDDGLIRRVETYPSRAAAVSAARHRAGNRFRGLFNTAAESMLLLDDEGRIVDANASASVLTALERRELIGRRLIELLPPRAADGWIRGWDDLRSNGRVDGQLVVLADGGERRPVRYWASAHFLPGMHLMLLHGGARGRSPVEPVLTPREREVMQMLARGLNAREVADRLVLSPATVRTHVQNAVKRLGASTRVQAIAIALDRGEIEL